MSVSIVSEDTLRMIVDEAKPVGGDARNLGRLLDESERLDVPSAFDKLSHVGQTLLSCNLRAWVERYEAKDLADADTEPYAHRRGIPAPAVKVLGAVDQLEYQLADWPAFAKRGEGLGGTGRFRFLDAVRRRAIQRLPGYSW